MATVSYFLTHAPDKQKLLNDYHLGTPVIREDIHCITAEYLINNIEMAFQSWQAAPWGKHIPFDLFCETILPYRVSTEPLENWREQVLASFAGIYRDLLDSTGMTAVRACSKVSGKLPSFIYNDHFPAMNFRQLMTSTRGRLEQQATLAVFVMRSMGIPVTWDIIIRRPSFTGQLAWNIVYDSASRTIPFSISKSLQPMEEYIPGHDRLIAKVYRNTFRRQEYSANIPSEIPSPFAGLIDVTAEYHDKIRDIDIAIQPADVVARPPEYACLAVARSSSEWTPVCWGKYHNGAYHFASVGVNILYLPVIYKNGQQKAINRPFFLTDNNEIIYFEQNLTKSSSTYPRWNNFNYKATNINITNSLSGRWLFEDTTNYGKATAGKDMTAYRMTTDNKKGRPSTEGFKQVEGPKAGKKAVRTPRYGYFHCPHGIAHNGAGKNINEYTIVMDIKFPVKTCYCFLQTDIDNVDDVDVFLYPDLVRFGISKFYCYFDPPLRVNEWYRLVISARLGQSLKYYLNGELVLVNYNTRHGIPDSRLSLAKEGLLLFADENGEDNDIDVSEVAVFNRALTDEEVFSLGCAGN